MATPIGAARDITLRALDILAGADVLVAEDTRTLKHLMRLHGIALGDRPVIAYHEHSGPAVRPRLVQMIAEGKSLAYASEAGTPLVADPGYQLGRAVIEAGLGVRTAPGPSAALAALTVSGLPSDRFFFAGFAPSAGAARRKWLAELAPVQATVILYESPKRVRSLLGDLVETFGEEREAAICRELTKRFEEVRRGSLRELFEGLENETVRGEIVVLIDRAAPVAASGAQVDDALREAMATQSLKDAVAEVSAALNLPRRKVYQAALKLESET